MLIGMCTPVASRVSPPIDLIGSSAGGLMGRPLVGRRGVSMELDAPLPLLEVEDDVSGPVLRELLPHHHREGLQVLTVYQHRRLRKDVEALLAKLRAEVEVRVGIGFGGWSISRFGREVEERLGSG